MKKNDTDIREKEILVITLTGRTRVENWLEKEKSTDFFDIKKISLDLLELMGVEYNKIEEEDESTNFSYGIKLYHGNTQLIELGELTDSITKPFDIHQNVFAAVVNWIEVVKLSSKAKTLSTAVSKYPSVERDLALIMDESISYKEISQIVARSSGSLLSQMQLFDVYKDEQKVGKGKKSYAIRLTFADSTKTLTDKNVDKVINKILGVLKHQLNIELR
jgi:phenylalanyl-tRNA synthetase beta chain